MLVDKMKEIPLVPESAVLKIDPLNKVFSRFDKTVNIDEPIPATLLVSGNKVAYVEASSFFSLLPNAKQVEITDTLCHLTLSNNAEYDLPLADVAWEHSPVELPESPVASIKLVSGRLSSATLKNLANPMLQCIYIDDGSAVSCNSMIACIDGNTTSSTPLILPPDIINIIEGLQSNIYIVDKKYVLLIDEATIEVPIPDIDYSETAQVLRDSLPIEELEQSSVNGLLDSIKRLSLLSEQVVFEKDRVLAGTNFEPFTLPTANNQFKYNIQNLLTVLPQVRTIAQSEYALMLMGDKFVFLISPETDE